MSRRAEPNAPARAVRIALAVLAAASLARAQGSPSDVGQWSPVQNWPLVAVHMQLLPSGDVLTWTDYSDGNGIEVWRPATGTFTPTPYPAVNMFCSGHTYLGDGRLLVAGGIVGSQDDLGPRESCTFDSRSATWTAAALMTQGRYYPTLTTLPDGRVLVQGGTTVCNSCIADRPEIYDPVTNIWTPMADSARKTFKYYPHTFVLPDGRILVEGQDDSATVAQVLDLGTQTWTTVDPLLVDGHSSVMYAPGKLMKAGKATQDAEGQPALASTYVLDMTQPTPAWQATAWMQYPRSYLNLTVLPDGQVLATGGGTTTDKANPAVAVNPAELWSPATKTWTTMSAAQNPRQYHSTALLLPDATVLVAGGGRQACTHPCPVPVPNDQQNAEIFSPPYLFKGARPAITSAPSVIPYGAAFSVTTPDAARIGSVALVGLGAVTHSFNENQRYVPIAFETGTGALTAHAPPNGNIAPPGPYMLFVVDTNGIPSVAAMTRLPSPSSDSQPPSAPASLTAMPTPGQVALSWSAATDDVAVAGYDVHRSTLSGFAPAAANRIGQTTDTGYTDIGMDSGTYYYVVRARDAAGNVSVPSNQVTVIAVADNTPPNPIPGIMIVSAGPGQISLSWGASSDDIGVVDYSIERCTGNGCTNFLQIGKRTGTSFDDLGLVASTAYSYRVRAEDARGNQGGYSDVVSAASSPATGGLVAAWGFNEGAGTGAVDLSGLANVGAINGAAWTGQGKFGGGMAFNGSTSEVDVPDAPSLDLAAAMTVEAWVKPAAASPSWTAIVHKNTDRYYLMASSDTNGLPAIGATFTSGNLNVFGTQTLPVGVWSHLAGTYDGTRLRLYLNGTQVATTPRTVPLTTSSQPLTIGADVYGEFFQGTLDEIRIYNRALSATEIQSDMAVPVQNGVVQFTLTKAPVTGAIALGWIDSAATGVYRVRRATGPAPADFATATCWVVSGTSFTDPAPATDGFSYEYLVDTKGSCP